MTGDKSMIDKHTELHLHVLESHKNPEAATLQRKYLADI